MRKARIAVLVSGGGTNLQAILDAQQRPARGLCAGAGGEGGRARDGDRQKSLRGAGGL